MKIPFLALAWALSCGAASSAPTSAPIAAPDPVSLPAITLPRTSVALSGLPPPDDPKRADWRESNQTVFRLGGHVGHWRGTLIAPAPAPERRP